MSGSRLKPINGLPPLIYVIYTLIKLDGRSIKEITQTAGVARNLLAMWFYGNRTPTVNSLDAILNTLGYNLVPMKVTEHDIRKYLARSTTRNRPVP